MVWKIALCAMRKELPSIWYFAPNQVRPFLRAMLKSKFAPKWKRGFPTAAHAKGGGKKNTKRVRVLKTPVWLEDTHHHPKTKG